MEKTKLTFASIVAPPTASSLIEGEVAIITGRNSRKMCSRSNFAICICVFLILTIIPVAVAQWDASFQIH